MTFPCYKFLWYFGGGAMKRKIIAIGGGKGGIGKSLVAANLALVFSRSGQRVVLVDADLGGANLHTCLGMQPPKLGIGDFIFNKVPTIQEVLSPTPYGGLYLISGALDYVGVANPKYTQKLRVIRELSRLDMDIIIIDCGAGTGFNVLDFFLLASHRICVMIPEATSIENAYRFIKMAYYRKLKNSSLNYGLKNTIDEVMASASGVRTPADLVQQVKQIEPAGGALLEAELALFSLDIVLNQLRLPEDGQIGAGIEKACKKFFGIPTSYLGGLPYEPEVWQAIRQRKPLVELFPEAKASQEFKNIAQKILSR